MCRFSFALTVLGLRFLAGCSPQQSEDDQVTLRVYTWWSEFGEKEAFAELERVHQETHPNVSVSKDVESSADEAFKTLDSLLYYRTPPDSFQANGGAKLLSRVVRLAGEDTRPQLIDLTKLIAESPSKIRDELSRLLTVGGKYYGVPVNIHRINNLYYNTSKLKGRPVPRDLDQFFELAKALTPQQNGKPISGRGAVGIGVDDTWTMEELVFENILPAVAASDPELAAAGIELDYFREFWMGDRDPKLELDYRIIDETLVYAQQLWPYVQRFRTTGPTSALGRWTDPFDALVDASSDVALVVMGDWASGYLHNRYPEREADIEVVPFPGTERVFIYTTDTFPMALGAPHEEATRDFLLTALSSEGQIQFNSLKGSIPAIELTSRQVSRLPPHQRRTIEEFERSDIARAPAMSGLFSPDIPTDLLRNALAVMFEQSVSDDPVSLAWGREVVHRKLENHYWMLKVWTKALNEKNR